MEELSSPSPRIPIYLVGSRNASDIQCFVVKVRIGAMAAAYVQGLQEHGVSATIKHFVGNDQEHERTAADSVMSERALREIYLYPYVQLLSFLSCNCMSL